MEIIFIIIIVLVMAIPTLYIYKRFESYFKEFKDYNNNILNQVTRKREKKPLFSFKKEYEVTSMPIITVKMFKNEYKFILDTGADFNALDKEAFDRIVQENELKLPENFFSETLPVVGGETVFGVGGVENNVKQVNLPFACGDVEFQENFSIVNIGAPLRAYEENGVLLCGVIGSPFFTENRWSLDFSELVVWVN